MKTSRTLRRLGPSVAAVLALLLATSSELHASDRSEALGRKLESLRRHFGLRTALGVVVRDLETGEILYSHNASKKFIPASGMKLAIMGASLHYLGPNYRFRTEFLGVGPLTESGVLRGDLFVRGSGDPSLTHHELDFIARSLAERGLRGIEGDVVLDDSFFDDQLRGPASYDNILKQGLPIQSALSYNFNRVDLRARPGSAGSRAVLHDGGYGYFDVANRVTTASRGRPWMRVQKLRGDRVVVRGRVISGDEEERVGSFIAPNPTEYFGSALVGKLAEQGIRVGGVVVKGEAPAGVDHLYVHTSARLIEVLGALGKYSNNFSAEQMIKALGAHRYGEPGSFATGGRAVGEYLVGLGFSKNDFRIEDGSGLSYDNHLSAAILSRVLEDLYHSPELRTDFICSLALGGVDGTLRRRFLNEKHMGRIMAKTGSLASVSSLSGFAFSERHGPVAFSVITNGIGRQYRADHVEDEIARALLDY